MSPEAAKTDLLYVSNLGKDQVNVYSYPAGSPMGRLTGFAVPHGMCTDKFGHLFVIDSVRSKIYEFAHGAMAPFRSFKDDGYFPQSCAVNPVNGDLAVTNFGPRGPGPGSVALYKRSRGPRTVLIAKRGLFHYYYDTYDGKGDLFVDGLNFKDNEFELYEVAAGTSTFVAIKPNAPIRLSGGVFWDGKYLVVGDQYPYNGPNSLTEFRIVGTAAKLVTLVNLPDSCNVLQFWVDRGKLIAPNDCGKSVMFWTFPDGGYAWKRIPVSQPVAVVISAAPH